MKMIVLYVLRALGFFYLSRRWVANKTLILAYHGFEVLDETEFRNQLFIKSSTLKSRFDYLKKHCQVIPLSEFCIHGDQKDGRKNKVVITIDDGWTSTLGVAAPIFKDYQLPYTVYLTTENVLDNQPIFHVALDYILGHSLGKRLNYTNDQSFELDIVVSSDNIASICQLIKPIKRESNDTPLLLDIANALQFDFDTIIKNKALTLMSVEQVKEIKAMGADIQLHTHTHDTPLDSYALFAEEINVNRDHIVDIVGGNPEHHCYPSGVYNESSFGYLQQLGVKTATTCYPGFCDEHSNPMELPRFLDAENIPQIIFEAEVSGVLELLRKLRKMTVGRIRGNQLSTNLQ